MCTVGRTKISLARNALRYRILTTPTLVSTTRPHPQTPLLPRYHNSSASDNNNNNTNDDINTNTNDINAARSWLANLHAQHAIPLLRSIGQVSFSRSSGPGGQNVNKYDTRVKLDMTRA
ncbi:hypothetical protein GQ44DRAFT_259848 [Phaeosphaeriaceae sp. PMI808]|nr:hypothetical protein GQ44DRAFT_259848 [Phaeosphaeriaceae sp. PMI808]